METKAATNTGTLTGLKKLDLNLAKRRRRSRRNAGAERVNVLEVLLAQCNDKANYLEMEMSHIRDSVTSITDSIKRLNNACEAMHAHQAYLLSHCHHQARATAAMGLMLAVCIGVSQDSMLVFLLTLTGVVLIAYDSLAPLVKGHPIKSSSSLSSSSSAAADSRASATLRTRSLRRQTRQAAPGRTAALKLEGKLSSRNMQHQLEPDVQAQQVNSSNVQLEDAQPSHGGQFFPHLTLTDKLDSHSHPKKLEFNSTEGLAFENDMFKGKVVFKLRPDDDSKLERPYQRYFSGRARKFSLQVQGTLKNACSPGIVWLGAEVGHCDEEKKGPDRMVLGFMRKFLCALVLKTINLMRGNILHYSFGDDRQLPHITLPAYIAADTFVETKQKVVGHDDDEKNHNDGHDNTSTSSRTNRLRGLVSAPPPIGVDMFPEDQNSQRLRRKGNKTFEFKQKSTTYSFSLHNSNLDLYNWEVKGIPGVRSMDLTNYWGTMPLRIVAYHTPEDDFSAPHSDQNKRYLFCFELRNNRAEPVFQAA